MDKILISFKTSLDSRIARHDLIQSLVQPPSTRVSSLLSDLFLVIIPSNCCEGVQTFGLASIALSRSFFEDADLPLSRCCDSGSLNNQTIPNLFRSPRSPFIVRSRTRNCAISDLGIPARSAVSTAWTVKLTRGNANALLILEDLHAKRELSIQAKLIHR